MKKKSLSPSTVTIVILSTLLAFSVIWNINFMLRGTNSVANKYFLDRAIKMFEKKPLSPLSCKYHDYSDSPEAIKTYTVKRGDTLLSVAKDLLGDVSRVNEIVNYNKKRYPSLSLATPFLEVGWELKYPPSEFPPATGRIVQARGIIVDIQANYWDILTDSYEGAAPSRYVGIYKAQFKDRTLGEYKIGDCVTILSDWPSNSSTVIPKLVTPQESK